jgi:hypothetical protein
MASPQRMVYAASAFAGSAVRAKWARVRIETADGVYVGQVFVPETKKRLSDVLCDERPFLNLTEVSINDSQILEPFVALSKRYIKAVRVIHEGEGEVVTMRQRG